MNLEGFLTRVRSSEHAPVAPRAIGKHFFIFVTGALVLGAPLLALNMPLTLHNRGLSVAAAAAPIAAPPTGGAVNDYFEALAPSAHRAYSLRQPRHNYPNSHVFLEKAGARFHTPEGRGGTPLKADLYLPLEFDQPTGGQEWVITWDVFWGEAFLEAINELNTWRNAKVLRILAADNLMGKRGTFWKQEMNFRSSFRPPEFALGWSQTDRDVAGADMTDLEPVRPAAFGKFRIRAGVWTRYWLQFSEQTPVDQPVSAVSVWMADETRGPVQVLGPLSIRMPWSDELQKGVQHLHLRVTAKRRRNGGPAVDFWMRNVMVLKNADFQSLLARPVG